MKIFTTGKKLEKELETLQRVNSVLQEQVESFQETEKLKNSLINENLRLKHEVDSLKAEVISTKNKLREQTEADILLNALKAIGIIQGPPEAKKEDYFKAHDMLSAQLRAQQMSPSPRTAFADALGGSLTGLFR